MSQRWRIYMYQQYRSGASLDQLKREFGLAAEELALHLEEARLCFEMQGPFAPSAGEEEAFERIDAEMDAAIVFAAAAKDAYENGMTEFSDTCWSDADDCYARVIHAFARTDLTGVQREYLQAKMNYLRRSPELRITCAEQDSDSSFCGERVREVIAPGAAITRANTCDP